MRLAQRIARAWNFFCGGVHRSFAATRLWQAERRVAQMHRHLGKAREHDWRADAYDRDPIELEADRPFRPHDHV